MYSYIIRILGLLWPNPTAWPWQPRHRPTWRWSRWPRTTFRPRSRPRSAGGRPTARGREDRPRGELVATKASPARTQLSPARNWSSQEIIHKFKWVAVAVVQVIKVGPWSGVQSPSRCCRMTPTSTCLITLLFNSFEKISGAPRLERGTAGWELRSMNAGEQASLRNHLEICKHWSTF